MAEETGSIPVAAAAAEKFVPTLVKFPDGYEGKFGKIAKVVKEVDSAKGTVTFYGKSGWFEVVEFAQLGAVNKIWAGLHGVSQKIGDEYSKVDDDGDAHEAVLDMRSRLYAEESAWARQSTEGAFRGSVFLIKALMELTRQTEDQVRATLKELPAGDREKLKSNSQVLPIIQRLEKEKAAQADATVGADVLAKFGLAA